MSDLDKFVPDNELTERLAAVRYVFLDRDGVINRKAPEGGYIIQCAELELLPGAAAAIARLNRSGRKAIVVTNQRGIALGLMTELEMDKLHDRLGTELSREGATLQAIYHCPHGL